jgi:uncharacterized protein
MKIFIVVFSLAALAGSQITDRTKTEPKESLDAVTVAYVQPGQMESERAFNLNGEHSSPVQCQGRFGRQGSKWFSFELPVDEAHTMALVVTYSNGERQKRTFDILVDGRKIGERVIEPRGPDRNVHFVDVKYAVPGDLVKGKQKVTLRFEASNGNEIAGVFGIRVIRTNTR